MTMNATQAMARPLPHFNARRSTRCRGVSGGVFTFGFSAQAPEGLLALFASVAFASASFALASTAFTASPFPTTSPFSGLRAPSFSTRTFFGTLDGEELIRGSEDVFAGGRDEGREG